jgi:hypothetical protein
MPWFPHDVRGLRQIKVELDRFVECPPPPGCIGHSSDALGHGTKALRILWVVNDGAVVLVFVVVSVATAHEGMDIFRGEPDQLVEFRDDAVVSAFVCRSYHAMQLSNPSVIFFPGRLRPMKTMRLWRFSSLFQGR